MQLLLTRKSIISVLYQNYLLFILLKQFTSNSDSNINKKIIYVFVLTSLLAGQ